MNVSAHHPLFLGLDCGGTSTRAALADATGQVLGIGLSGATNPNTSDEQSIAIRIHEAYSVALQNARRRLEDVSAIFVGMAGVSDEAEANNARAILREAGLDLPGIAVGLDHDIRIALAGGLPGQEGIALVAGTGASCYGRTDDGRSWKAGGWGPILDDAGSACGLGYAAMRAVVRIADGRLPPSPLLREISDLLQLQTTRDIIDRVYRTGMPPTQIAKLAPAVIQIWRKGDPVAQQIIEESVTELAQLVLAVARNLRLDAAQVCCTGGLVDNAPDYRQIVIQRIESQCPGLTVTRALLPPVLGAVLLALDSRAQPHDARVWDRLRNSYVRLSNS